MREVQAASFPGSYAEAQKLAKVGRETLGPQLRKTLGLTRDLEGLAGREVLDGSARSTVKRL